MNDRNSLVVSLRAVMFVFFALAVLLYWSFTFAQSAPAFMLANSYDESVDLKQYWVSEKYDGVRAYWDGKVLQTRGGLTIAVPDAFLQGFPNVHLDGELWMGRQQFDSVSGLIRQKSSHIDQWRDVKYMVFDLPQANGTFDERLLQMRQWEKHLQTPVIHIVPQRKMAGHQQLMAWLSAVVEQGGEGLMLHKGDSLYHSGRSNDLLKLKTYQDAEAIVTGHTPGKGKFKGMMGALQVKMRSGLTFKIGSGFSDAVRRNPPAPGSVITFRYYGYTANGTPRFASFMRMHHGD